MGNPQTARLEVAENPATLVSLGEFAGKVKLKNLGPWTIYLFGANAPVPPETEVAVNVGRSYPLEVGESLVIDHSDPSVDSTVLAAGTLDSRVSTLAAIFLS